MCPAEISLVKLLLKKLTSIQVSFERMSLTGPHKVLGQLFQIRKMRLLQHSVFWARFMYFQKYLEACAF